MKWLPAIVMLTLILGANFYVFYRLWHMIPMGVAGRVLLVTAGILLVSFIFLSLAAGNVLPSPVLSFMYRTGTSWFFIFLYLLIIFLLLDLIKVTNLLPVEKYMFNSWIGTGVLAGFIAVVMTFGFVRYHQKARVDLPVTLHKEMEGSAPLKIVALSDLHMGYNIGNKELEKWVELINKEEPDLVLLAGDMIDNNLRPLEEQHMDRVLRKIKARYGVYAAVGNHEYISGISNSVRFLEDAGIRVLRDTAVLVDSAVYIVGRDDRTNPDRKPLADLVGHLDRSKPVILLDHQPEHLEEAEQNQIDLQISGHTHYGQVIPVSWLTNLIFEKAHGYLKKGNTHIYVSSGMGIWGGKFRIGTRSEYIVITLSGK